jgi:hypothetical protein
MTAHPPPSLPATPIVVSSVSSAAVALTTSYKLNRESVEFVWATRARTHRNPYPHHGYGFLWVRVTGLYKKI